MFPLKMVIFNSYVKLPEGNMIKEYQRHAALYGFEARIWIEVQQ